MRDIAHRSGVYTLQELGTRLDLEDYEIANYDQPYEPIYERKYQILQRWKQISGKNATYGNLLVALCKLKPDDNTFLEDVYKFILKEQKDINELDYKYMENDKPQLMILKDLKEELDEKENSHLEDIFEPTCVYMDTLLESCIHRTELSTEMIKYENVKYNCLYERYKRLMRYNSQLLQENYELKKKAKRHIEYDKNRVTLARQQSLESQGSLGDDHRNETTPITPYTLSDLGNSSCGHMN